jgi:hypothetical protein
VGLAEIGIYVSGPLIHPILFLLAELIVKLLVKIRVISRSSF